MCGEQEHNRTNFQVESDWWQWTTAGHPSQEVSAQKDPLRNILWWKPDGFTITMNIKKAASVDKNEDDHQTIHRMFP